MVGDRGGWRPRVAGARAQTDVFLTSFCRTELIIGASKAKNCEEFDFEVRLPLQPLKLAQRGKTRVLRLSYDFFLSRQIV